jgi:2-(1,2-epoxy-1,2-dihydrophenyl)acetyl-CoA isomerase
MTYECLLYEVKDGIATLTLNRPDRLNALGGSLRDDLHDAITRSSADPEVRVMIVTGSGKGFCAGGDVKAMNEAKEGRRERPLVEMIAPGRDRTLLAMRDAPQPIIAAVNGAAAGAGLSLACACDLRVAADSAAFVPAFVNVGLVPDTGGSWLVPRLLGYARAFEWMCSGRKIGADEALAWGLVSEVVAGAGVLSRTQERAAELAALPTRAIAMTKRLFERAAGSSLGDQLELEAQLQVAATRTEDFAEGVAAFLEKRDPRFTGR